MRRNCLLQLVIERKIQWGDRSDRKTRKKTRKLLDDLKEKRGYSHLKEEALRQRLIERKIKGGIYVTGRRGRRCRKLLNDLKENSRYCHLREEALDRTMWRARFGRGFGPVVRQTDE